MNRALFQTILPDEYVRRFLKTNQREDNRLFNQSRKIVIQKGKFIF